MCNQEKLAAGAPPEATKIWRFQAVSDAIFAFLLLLWAARPPHTPSPAHTLRQQAELAVITLSSLSLSTVHCEPRTHVLATIRTTHNNRVH